jgi:hypothetical protein
MSVRAHSDVLMRIAANDNKAAFRTDGIDFATLPAFRIFVWALKFWLSITYR